MAEVVKGGSKLQKRVKRGRNWSNVAKIGEKSDEKKFKKFYEYVISTSKLSNSLAHLLAQMR